MDQPVQIATVKLQQTEPEANYFENNQVLSADQLNNVVKYFDYQQRLTRTRLAGVGIVCGLNLQFDGSIGTIKITPGCGITTDGDVIHVDQDGMTFSSLIPFDDKNAHYSFFVDANNPVKQIALWELVNNTNDPDAQPLGSFFAAPNVADNFAVLLYLESYGLDAALCTSDDCVSKGLVQRNVLRALLIGKSDLQLIVKSCACCSEQYFDLKEVAVFRPVFNPDSVFKFSDMAGIYQSAIAATVVQLEDALKSCDNVFSTLTNCNGQAGNNMPADTGNTNSGNGRSETLLSIIDAEVSHLGDQPGVQYLYDFVRDVAEAYNEFKESVYDLCVNCNPDPSMFPKHLMLGELIPSGDFASSDFRNDFCESPILNHKNEWVEKALLFYNRIESLIINFNYTPDAAQQIRVTPSLNVKKPLGERAIPYYYNSGVVKEWNYEKNKRRKTNTILSYRATDYSTLPQVTDPLTFELDQFDFFRIEGHIGKTFEDAFNQINAMRFSQDLPFDIIGLQLEQIRETVLPTRPVRFPITEMQFHMVKNVFADHLSKIQAFHDHIATNIATTATATSLTNLTTMPNFANVFNDAMVNLNNNITTSKDAITNSQNILEGSIADYDHPTFLGHFTNAVNQSMEVTRNAEKLSANWNTPPVHSMVNTINPALLDILHTTWNQKKDAFTDKYIFSNFLTEHPALLHHGGVSRGGTFILVYESLSRAVVADFYLPYMQIQNEIEPQVNMPVISRESGNGIDFSRFVRLGLVDPDIMHAITMDSLNKVSESVISLSPPKVLVNNFTEDNVPGMFTPPPPPPPPQPAEVIFPMVIIPPPPPPPPQGEIIFHPFIMKKFG